MIHVNNIKDSLPDDLINFMLTNKGERKPNSVIESYQQIIYDTWQNAGIDLSRVGWEFFNSDNLINHLDLPFTGNVKWWFSKLNPGDMFPLHLDTYPNETIVERYWVACQDHMPGHVFVSGHNTLQDYKKGDVFKFEATDAWHGACNLGFIPKISLQVLVTG
jgi:hypothetical protein